LNDGDDGAEAEATAAAAAATMMVRTVEDQLEAARICKFAYTTLKFPGMWQGAAPTVLHRLEQHGVMRLR
jgi:hypothetical protein